MAAFLESVVVQSASVHGDSSVMLTRACELLNVHLGSFLTIFSLPTSVRQTGRIHQAFHCFDRQQKCNGVVHQYVNSPCIAVLKLQEQIADRRHQWEPIKLTTLRRPY